MSIGGEQIIGQIKFLGIEFYKRTRLEEHEIQITARQNITKYPGLLVTSTSIPFPAINPSWDMIAHQSIELTLLDLIINDFVELIVFTDTKHYLDDLITNEYKNYRLVIKNEYWGKDILSQSIINAIKYVERDKGKKADLKVFIKYLLDGYLDKNKTYVRPQKTFITALYRRYDRKHSWLTVVIEEYILYPSKVKLTITQQKQAQLKKAHKTLFDIVGVIKRESRIFSLYSDEFYKIIQSEFERREPNND